MEENCGLIVFEAAMNARYKELARIHGFKVFTVNLDNNLSPKLVDNIIKRIKTKESLKQGLLAISKFIRDNNFNVVYLSNAEGYVSMNFLYPLKKEFPNISFRALQHGIFPLTHSYIKEALRKTINRAAYFFTGVFIFGEGFGGIKLDKYYVYSDRERDFLLRKKGWRSEAVIADIRFIKAELYEMFLNSTSKQDEGTVLLLLQGLYRAGLCTEKEEESLIQGTIDYLSANFNKVLIKEHPSCGNRLKDMSMPKNAEEVETMLEGFYKSKSAYSFFSTSLIDAKIFEIKTYGIYSNWIKVDPELYENFDVKVQFEDTICPKS